MDTFDFPYHTVEFEYPDSSGILKFGRGWEFASKPKGPDQRIFILNFNTMVYYLASGPGGGYNLTKNAQYNAGALEKFYQDHRQYEPFKYPHPGEGNITVRFKDPLKLKLKVAGLGTVEPFQIRLTELP